MNMIYNALWVHVSASDLDVMRALRAKWLPNMRDCPTLREQRHAFYRGVLRCHHQWQAACAEMGGR